MTQLVDRHDEVRELSALADAGRPKLALLYGRRRVGKTFLLTNIWPAERALYFTASATTPEQNRRHLVGSDRVHPRPAYSASLSPSTAVAGSRA